MDVDRSAINSLGIRWDLGAIHDQATAAKAKPGAVTIREWCICRAAKGFERFLARRGSVCVTGWIFMTPPELHAEFSLGLGEFLNRKPKVLF